MGSLLHDLKIGKAGVVRRINAEKCHQCRLNSMGIFPGAPIKVITKGPSGCLVTVGCSRISLEPDLAKCILVS